MGSRLKDKVAIITGASQGIGKELAIAFAEEGAYTVLVDSDELECQAVLNEIVLRGGEGMALGGDYTTDESGVTDDIKSVYLRYQRCDILVNHSAHVVTGRLHEVNTEAFDTAINHNLRSIFLFTRSVVPHMIRNKSGCVLNLSTTAGLQPFENLALEAALKGSIFALSRAMAADYENIGIRVHALASDALMDASRHTEFIERAVFLASPEGASLTGTIFAPGRKPSSK